MTLNKSLLLLLILSSLSPIYGQDTIATKPINSRLKIGVYLSKKEFAVRTPSIQKPIVVIPVYKTKDSSTFIDGYSFSFKDGSARPKDYLCFSDGEYLYYGNTRLQGSLGKYPFYTFTDEVINTPIGLDPLGLIVTLADRALAKPKIGLMFFNEKGWKCEGTVNNITFILHDFKELGKAFWKEKDKSIEVRIKYLELLNERYPY